MANSRERFNVGNNPSYIPFSCFQVVFMHIPKSQYGWVYLYRKPSSIIERLQRQYMAFYVSYTNTISTI